MGEKIETEPNFSTKITCEKLKTVVCIIDPPLVPIMLSDSVTYKSSI